MKRPFFLFSLFQLFAGFFSLGIVNNAAAFVADVEAYFAQTCLDADEALGEPAACRRFLDWFDRTPRPQMRAQLLAEVHRALAQRQPAAA